MTTYAQTTTRLTVDVRINERPSYFFAFEGPRLEINRAEALDLEFLFRSSVSDFMSPIGLMIEKVGVNFGSIHFGLFLINHAPEIVSAGAAIGGVIFDHAQDMAIETMIRNGVVTFWRSLRGRRTGTPAGYEDMALQESANLLGLARRVAAQESVLRGCVPHLVSPPKPLAEEARFTFRLVGAIPHSGELTVKARYDGRGYTVSYDRVISGPRR